MWVHPQPEEGLHRGFQGGCVREQSLDIPALFINAFALRLDVLAQPGK